MSVEEMVEPVKKSKAERTRERIEAAAAALFVEKGVDGATTREIARTRRSGGGDFVPPLQKQRRHRHASLLFDPRFFGGASQRGGSQRGERCGESVGDGGQYVRLRRRQLGLVQLSSVEHARVYSTPP